VRQASRCVCNCLHCMACKIEFARVVRSCNMRGIRCGDHLGPPYLPWTRPRGNNIVGSRCLPPQPHFGPKLSTRRFKVVLSDTFGVRGVDSEAINRHFRIPRQGIGCGGIRPSEVSICWVM
jgi:hypothetical protein